MNKTLDEAMPGGLIPSSPDLDILVLMFPQNNKNNNNKLYAYSPMLYFSPYSPTI